MGRLAALDAARLASAMRIGIDFCQAALIWLCTVCLCVIAAFGQPAPRPVAPSAEQVLERALQAAKTGDLAAARTILQTGAHVHPEDPRFPTELAGIAFLEKHNTEAKRLLHRARHLRSADPYVSEFLGTLYLLDGNAEAALALWNPIGKPVLADAPADTGLNGILRTSLASDAVAFASGRILTRNSMLRAERVTALLGVCGSSRMLLELAGDDRYHAHIQCVERPALGRNRVASLLMLARGLGYQTLHIQMPNIGRRAWSWNSMLRWDARKRRVWMETAMPFAGRAGWRVRVDGDARHEYWQALDAESRRVDQSFLYRRAEAGFAISAVLGSKTTWANRLSLANRSFADATMRTPSAKDETSLLPSGTSVRYAHLIESDIYRNPLRRIVATASANGSFERYLAVASNVVRAEGSLTLAWSPAASSEDGRTSLRVAAGTLRGRPALPELFSIGMERDCTVPLRGHIGTSHGHKGSALYGDRYLAANLEVRKTLIRMGIVTLSVAPFLDAAWVRDPNHRFGARKIQYDAGLQWIASTPGGTEIRLSYAWDLRNQRQSFYAYSEPYP